MKKLWLVLLALVLYSAQACAANTYIAPTACTATCVIGPLQTGPLSLATVSVNASGSGSGLTFAFQGSTDGTNWTTLPGFVPATGASTTTPAANGNWVVSTTGYSLFRVNLTAIGGGTETFAVTGAPGVVVVYTQSNATISGVVSLANTATSGDVTLTTATTVYTACTTPAHGYTINNVDATNGMWASDHGNATANTKGSFYVPPLTTYQTPATYKPVGTLTLTGVVNGQQATVGCY